MDDNDQDYLINSNVNDIINIQNSTIKKLNDQLSIYKSKIKEQRERIFSCDNLIINFNSLNNAYIKLKNENEILIQKLFEKNKIINEYQNLFFESKCKILLFNQLNETLQEKINFLLSTTSKSLYKNTEFNQKINFFDSKLKKIKDECTKKEEELRNKLFETIVNNKDIDQIDHQRKINELEFELSLAKKINENYAKEKEDINKKSNDIFNERNKINKEIIEYKNKNKKLKEENEYLTEYFSNKGKEFNNILLNIKQNNGNNIKELSQKDVIINNLMKDKEILYQEIEKLNAKNILLKNIYDKKYQKLKEIVDNIEKEKNEKEKEINRKDQKENDKLKEEILNYKKDIENFKINEGKYIKEIDELNKVIQNMKKNKNINKTVFHCYDNQFGYTCNFCNCKHVLCKECENNYLNKN